MNGYLEGLNKKCTHKVETYEDSSDSAGSAIVGRHA